MKSQYARRRFLCPECKTPIGLKQVIGKLPMKSESNWMACCDSCRRVFSIEDWRRFYGAFDPHEDEIEEDEGLDF